MPRKKPDYPDQEQYDRESNEFSIRCGMQLRALRETAGISRQDAADAAHISLATLSRIENGTDHGAAPELSMFEFGRLCDRYNVKMVDVIAALSGDSTAPSGKDDTIQRIMGMVIQMTPKHRTALLKILDILLEDA